jgi:DNA (cytosine-5)-methyltransferase 1
LAENNLFKLPSTDLIVGGFPCQDYSVAKSLRASKGINGKKGVLWWPLLKVINIKKPRYVLLENVDRLLKSPAKQPGRDFAIMLKTLTDLGYLVEWRVINAADYGFPQKRKRVFIYARKGKSPKDKLHYILHDSIFARAFPAELKGKTKDFRLDGETWELSRNFSRGNKKSPFGAAGIYDGESILTADVRAKYKGRQRVLGDLILPTKSVPSEYWIPESQLKSWRYLKGPKAIPRESKSGHQYLYAEGAMSFPDSLASPSRTILTAEGGSSPSRFRHVIQQGSRFRRLTPIELERLNGFPDDWTKFGARGEKFSDSRRAFFMGNALVVGVIERLAKEIARDAKGRKRI